MRKLRIGYDEAKQHVTVACNSMFITNRKPLSQLLTLL